MIQPHELADMRQAADKAPFDVQQKFHALLDAYEDQNDGTAEDLEQLQEKASDAVKALREVFPDEGRIFREQQKKEAFGEPLPDDEWNDRLEDTPNDTERAAIKEEELERARAAEVKLRARVEALEDAIESALGELE